MTEDNARATGRSGNIETNRFGPSRDQQRTVRQTVAVGGPHQSRVGFDRDRACAKPQINIVLPIKLRIPQRNPFLARGAGEEIFRHLADHKVLQRPR